MGFLVVVRFVAGRWPEMGLRWLDLCFGFVFAGVLLSMVADEGFVVELV